jgi:hypothetical protein
MPQTTETSLYLTESKDGGVLLDLKHDRMLKLNTSGLLMWKLLSQGFALDDIARRLAQEYQVDEARIRQDVQNLLKSAAELGLDPHAAVTITEEEGRDNGPNQLAKSFPWYGQTENDKRPKPRRLVVLRAFFGLVWFDATLSLRSFEALCRNVKQWPLKRQSAEASGETIGEVCSAVERACVWYPKKALCLQRSAITTCLLREQGIAARMIVGARAMPMAAHAWVEVDGAIVNDWPRVRKFYPPLSSY